MTPTSNQTYRELSFPFLREVFIAIDKVCGELGIEYYLIGAQARDFHFLEKGIKPNRGTQDVDFAVMLPEMKLYDEMINLLQKEGFRKVNEPYRLIHDKTNTVMDILPYGEVEEEGTVKFTERETELSVIGIKEVAESAISFEIEGKSIRVSPLEGIVILKLVSYSESPSRTKDLDDIHNIIDNYFDLNDERVYEELEENVLDEFPPYSYIGFAGARLLGRDMNRILVQSEKLSALIKEIIQKELEEESGTITQYFIGREYFREHELIKSIFEQLLKGIND